MLDRYLRGFVGWFKRGAYPLQCVKVQFLQCDLTCLIKAWHFIKNPTQLHLTQILTEPEKKTSESDKPFHKDLHKPITQNPPSKIHAHRFMAHEEERAKR